MPFSLILYMVYISMYSIYKNTSKSFARYCFVLIETFENLQMADIKMFINRQPS